jgi:Na+/melibiose symporter-like transporter
MGSMGDSFRSRWAFVGGTLVRRPWLVVSWFLLAVVAVAAWKIVPQPWSAGVYPVVLFAALLLFSRASAQKR